MNPYIVQSFHRERGQCSNCFEKDVIVQRSVVVPLLDASDFLAQDAVPKSPKHVLLCYFCYDRITETRILIDKDAPHGESWRWVPKVPYTTVGRRIIHKPFSSTIHST